MSIAVSAVVKSSRLLIALVGICCAGVASIGIAIVSGRIGELPFGWRMALGPSCFFLAFFGAYRTLRTIKAHRIDISGNGRILIRETSPLAGVPFPSAHPGGVATGEPVELRSDSTLWPFLLLLNLQAESRSFTVPVLPDSLGREEFKRLLVACRWIAARPESEGQADFSDISQ